MPRRKSATSYGEKGGNTPNRTTPGTGRPPDTFYGRLNVLLERQRTADNVQAILDDPDHKHFTKMLEFAADRTKGKPPQSVDLTSKGEPLSGVVILPEVRTDPTA